MSFRNDGYLKIWKINPGRFADTTDVRVSSSRKKKDGTYETDFSGFVTLYGDANTKLNQMKLKEGDSIKVIRCDVTNSFNKAKNTTYTNYRIFDFEQANGMPEGDAAGNSVRQVAKKPEPKPDPSEGENEDFPL